jgi:hypothetical protein
MRTTLTRALRDFSGRLWKLDGSKNVIFQAVDPLRCSTDALAGGRLGLEACSARVG